VRKNPGCPESDITVCNLVSQAQNPVKPLPGKGSPKMPENTE
jgi:hypothetical protein